MTQELIDELLVAITLLLDDLKDIKENSYQMDQLIDQLESKANEVGITIYGLEQNVEHLDARLSQVLEGLMKNTGKNITKYREIS